MGCRTILVWGPKEGVGRTTVAARLGCDLTAGRNVVGVMDLNRYSSSLPLVLNNEDGGGLREAYASIGGESIGSFFSKACVEGVKGLFFLSLGRNDMIDGLYRFSEDVILRIIERCVPLFDYLVVIVPSNYIETGFVASMKVDTQDMIVVLDEDVSTWHRYRSYGQFFQRLGICHERRLLVVNKSNGIIEWDGLPGTGFPADGGVVTIPFNLNIKVAKNMVGVYRNGLALSRLEKRTAEAFGAICSSFR
jgi:MinD-like ATPase involved in chromosome partitioning or flagellar assembly